VLDLYTYYFILVAPATGNDGQVSNSVFASSVYWYRL